MPILPGGFTYTAPTTVTAVVSAVGPTTGGETVIVIGTEFRYGAGVTFGGVAATGVSISDINHISCVIPAHAAGAVDVVVTNTTGISPTGTLVNGFTYQVAAPTVTAILPIEGSTAGGEAVVITGTAFVATPGVKFGGTAATSVVFIDANHLSSTTPAHAAATVDVTVTNPDTQVGVLTGGFTFDVVAPFTDTGGWWLSSDGFTGGTDVVVSPGVPKHPRAWSKLSAFATGGGLALGGSPAASVNYKNTIIYAGDDYVGGTDQPTIRVFDGLADRLMTRIPNTTAGVVPKAIMAMLLVGDTIYVSTFDSGTTSANYAGRVFTFDPLSQTLRPLATGFTAGEVPYALAWHMDRLWVGTNQSDTAAGSIYFIRPGIDLTWTTDYTLATSSVGGALSLLSFQGSLFVGTDNAAASFSKVLKRDSLGAYTTSDTGTGGTARVNNGFYSLTEFGGNLYAGYWNNDTTAIAKVRKFDGTTWTTSFSGATLTLRPYILGFVANKFLYMAGGGVGERASLIRTPDGTTWTNLTAYLAGPITETVLPMLGVVVL